MTFNGLKYVNEFNTFQNRFKKNLSRFQILDFEQYFKVESPLWYPNWPKIYHKSRRLEQIFHWSQVKNDSTMLFFSIYDVKLVVISIAHKKPAKAIIYENV